MRDKWIRTLLIGLACMLLFPSIAGAHAYLDRSFPIQESSLDKSPTELSVQFTEPIDTKVSQVRLENEDGEVIDAEQYSVDHLSMTLAIPPLEDGVYYVYWQVLSLDTHVTDGSFRFAVGVELPPLRPEETIVIGGNESVCEPDHTAFAGFNLLNMGARIIDLLIMMLIGGWIFFHRFIWNREGDRAISQKFSKKLMERRLLLAALFAFIATGIIHIISRSIQLSQTTFSDALLWQTAGAILTSTMIGTVSLIRPVIVAILLALSYRPKLKKVTNPILVIGLTVTFGLTGHAMHTFMVLSHTVHMLALSVWFGGLIGFIVYSFRLKKQSDSLYYMHDRLKFFSNIALLMVILVIVTGVLLSYEYIGSMNDLTDTEYGNILLWKLGIFSLIILIAAFHRFVWLPNVKKVDNLEEKGKQMMYLFWALRVELLLAIIVLIVAGMLSTASPPVDGHEYHHDYH